MEMEFGTEQADGIVSDYSVWSCEIHGVGTEAPVATGMPGAGFTQWCPKCWADGEWTQVEPICWKARR